MEEIHEVIRYKCRGDFELFCNLFFSHYCKKPFNQFHRDTIEDYKVPVRGVRAADGAPRGYAKSTLKTLLKPLHDIVYGFESYILVLADTNTQAIQKLKDIRREILTNEFFADVYGAKFPSKNVGSQSFEILCGDHRCMVQAAGSETEVRGFRYGESRPTKIILDDFENSEEILNEDLRQKLREKYFEVISKLGTQDTNIEIVGTILHRDSLLMHLKKNPAYKTRIYQAIISWAERQDLWEQWREIYRNIENDNRKEEADVFFEAHRAEMLKGSKVLWPEHEDYLTLMKEIEETGKRAFMKEKQNAPLPSDMALFDNLWWYRETEQNGKKGFLIEKTGVFVPRSEMYGYGAMDPATGESKSKKNKTKLDYTCILSGFKDLKGRLFVHKDYTKRVKPTVYIQQIFEHYLEMQYEKFGVEENLYRGLLTENLKRERTRLEEERKKSNVEDWGIKVPFYEIENRAKKEERIFTLEPKVNNGWILFNRTLSVDFMQMLEEFPASDHDDGPDTLEMLWGLVTNRYSTKGASLNLMGR